MPVSQLQNLVLRKIINKRLSILRKESSTLFCSIIEDENEEQFLFLDAFSHLALSWSINYRLMDDIGTWSSTLFLLFREFN